LTLNYSYYTPCKTQTIQGAVYIVMGASNQTSPTIVDVDVTWYCDVVSSYTGVTAVATAKLNHLELGNLMLNDVQLDVTIGQAYAKLPPAPPSPPPPLPSPPPPPPAFVDGQTYVTTYELGGETSFITKCADCVHDFIVVGGGGGGGGGGYRTSGGGGGGTVVAGRFVPGAFNVTYNVVVGAGGTSSYMHSGHGGGASRLFGPGLDVIGLGGGGGGTGFTGPSPGCGGGFGHSTLQSTGNINGYSRGYSLGDVFVPYSAALLLPFLPTVSGLVWKSSTGVIIPNSLWLASDAYTDVDGLVGGGSSCVAAGNLSVSSPSGVYTLSFESYGAQADLIVRGTSNAVVWSWVRPHEQLI